MDKTGIKTIVTLDNVIATSEMEQWLLWIQRLDMNKWEASILKRKNGNLYILKRIKMKPQTDNYFQDDTPYMPDGNDLLKILTRLIKTMLLGILVGGCLIIIYYILK